MTQYYYEIGTSIETMSNIELWDIPVPFHDSYIPHSVEVDGADGLVYGHGWELTGWRWGFLHQDYRDILKNFCPGKSAEVYIRTLDDNGNWDYCKANMIWPTQETPQNNGYIFDFSIQFRIVQNYGTSPP
jgi:hypothetical protein